MEHPAALARRRRHVPLARGRAGRRAVRARARRARDADRGAASRRSGSSRPRSSRCRRSRTSVRSLEGEPESGAGTRRSSVTDEYVVAAYGEALVELAGRARGPRRARRRSRVGLPRARVRARLPGALRRVRHRRAGHGLDGRRAGAPRAAPGRQLVRVASSRRARTSRSTTRRARGRRSSTRSTTRG